MCTKPDRSGQAVQHHRLARCDGGSALCAGEALILPYKCTADEQAPAHLSEHRPGLSKDSRRTVVSFTHTNYVLAGAHVGAYPTIDSDLAHSTLPYLSLLHDIASLPLRHVYPTFLAVKVAFSPTSKFGHHFSAQLGGGRKLGEEGNGCVSLSEQEARGLLPRGGVCEVFLKSGVLGE